MSDFGPSFGIDPNDNTVVYARDNRMVVRFYRAMKRDNYNSKLLGRVVENPVDMVEIKRPGEHDSTVRVVEESDKLRWPGFWKAYVDGREQVAQGISLDILFPGNPEVIADLKNRNVHTIEALADLPDTVNFPFAGDFKERAKKFLAAQADGEKFLALERRAAQSEQTVAEMRDMIQKMQLELEAAKLPKRGPGRPRKNPIEPADDEDETDDENLPN